jgi:hypothetical protein
MGRHKNEISSEKNSEKPTHSKGAQEVSDMFGKDQAMLDRISEVRRKCSDGVKMLPVVSYERKLWFLDERLRQLRNVRNPHDFINLNDFEVEYFIRKVV